MRLDSLRLRVAAGAAALCAAVAVTAAHADDIFNNVDGSIDATVETLPMSFPGGSSTVTFAVAPTGNGQNPADGKQGCNLTGQTTLVVNVNSSDPTVASVSDNQLTFGSCGDLKQITLTPLKVGTTTISLSQSSNNTGATFDLAPATFSVNVTAPAVSDTTNPTIQFLQTPDGNADWFRTSPASVLVTATDASGISTLSCTLDGNPVAFDAGSTGDSATTKYGRVSTSSEGSHAVACSATDASSNHNAASDSTTLKLDTGDPTVTPDSVVNTTWRNSPLAQTFFASDSVSGLLTGQGLGVNDEFTLTASAESTLDGGGGVIPTVVSKTVEDVAGNSTTRSVSAWIDLTKPVLGVTDNNAASADICSGAPTKPTFQPSDALSGLDLAHTGESWVPAGSASGVGTYTYSASAADNAGNSDSYGPKSYKVAYGGAVGGILQPINTDGSSRFKLGSTIPVKFKIMCGTTPVSNAVASLTVKQGDTAPDPGVDEAISTAAATTGNLFRYDTTGQQYIFNLSTKSGYLNPGATTAVPFSQGTWTLGINLDDGTSRTVKLQLVR